MNYLKQHLPLFVELKESFENNPYADFMCFESEEFCKLWNNDLIFRMALRAEAMIFSKSHGNCEKTEDNLEYLEMGLRSLFQYKSQDFESIKEQTLSFLEYLITKLT